MAFALKGITMHNHAEANWNVSIQVMVSLSVQEHVALASLQQGNSMLTVALRWSQANGIRILTKEFGDRRSGKHRSRTRYFQRRRKRNGSAPKELN